MIEITVNRPQGKRWGEQGTRFRRDDPATAAIYRASHNPKPAQAGQHMEG